MKNKDSIKNQSRKARIAENTSPFMRLLKSAFKALAISVSAALIFIFLGCVIAYSTNDPTKFTFAISISSLLLSFFICGFATSKLCRGKPLLAGSMAGGIYLCVLLASSFLIKSVSNGAISPGIRTVIWLITIPIAVVGGFFGNIRIAKKKSAATYLKRRR
ncbi:MAG: TIGR04086 family membrane protein [Clostridia bacterium]|nr:TIGR04086 family membrane protein [Clostridia bacterium]